MRKQLNQRAQEIKMRANDIQDLLKKENRLMTDAERQEVEALNRELDTIRLSTLQSNIPASDISQLRDTDFNEFVRESVNSREQSVSVLQRDAMTTADTGALIPLTIGEIIKPLEEGLILDLVGIKLQTGLAGAYVNPLVGRIEASFADEAVALSDTEIPLTEVRPSPKRLGVSTSLTSQTINQTKGSIREIVVDQLVMAMKRTLNKAMFSPVAIAGGTTSPFATILTADASGSALSALNTKAKKKACSHIKFAGALPTYEELLAMKGLVLAKGVINDGTAAFVMDEYTKSALEATPRDAGSGRMIVEDGRIGGYPVFCTNDINGATADYIGFGVWSYELLGQFGDMRFVVDPISGAKSDVTIFTVNADWSMTPARIEAFCLGSYPAAG